MLRRLVLAANSWTVLHLARPEVCLLCLLGVLCRRPPWPGPDPCSHQPHGHTGLCGLQHNIQAIKRSQVHNISWRYASRACAAANYMYVCMIVPAECSKSHTVDAMSYVLTAGTAAQPVSGTKRSVKFSRWWTWAARQR